MGLPTEQASCSDTGGCGMKQVEITSKIIGRGGSTTSASPSLDLSGYALISDLLNYVTISGNEDVTGLHDFVNGLKIGGLPITKKQDDVVYLDANLVVRGGITMYGDGEGGSSIPSYSTLGSLLNVDESNDAVASVDRVLFQSAGSNVWSWKALSEIGGGSSGGGSVSGDYLPLSGGTLSSTSIPLGIDRKGGEYSSIDFMLNGERKGILGFSNTGDFVVSPNRPSNSDYFIGIHSNNIGSYNAGSATKLKTARTIWGQSFNGTANIDGAFYMNNNTHIYFKDASGSNMIGMYASTGSNLIIGNGFAESGHDLYLSGANIYLRYGIAKTTGLVLASSGNATFSCNILPSSTETYYIGDWNNYFTMANINVIYSGAPSNNMWLVGGNSSDSRGVVIGRNSTNTTTGSEICRFNANGMVWASGVYGDIRTTDTNIYLRRAGLNTNTLILGNGYFTPDSESADLLKLGRPNARWNGVYLGTASSAVNTQGVVFCDSSSKQRAFIGTNNSGTCGIYTTNLIVLRPGGTSNSDGTMTNPSIGVEVSSSGLLCTGGITMYSDQRKKTILNHVELSLKQIADAPLIQHYYNSDQDKTTHVGSIAQYWAQINDWFCKLDNEGYYTMEIQNCALASAISIARHLERYETKTDKTIRKMKQRIQELEDEVERLKQN